jgi:CHAD domain-containing protein
VAWRRLLAHCSSKPTRKRVHALRVTTLRILAELEYRIGDKEKGTPGAQAATRWIKLGEKLRQALGPVREADVWLDQLADLRKSLRDTSGYSPRSNKACIRQIDELENRLREKRRQWEKELVAEIEIRRDRLEESAQQIQIGPYQSAGAGGSAHDAVASQIADEFARVASEFPSLDSDNLHEFRKRIKKVRYRAEIFTKNDPEAGRQAASIRRMQSAIGAWHDWHVLAKKEAHANGAHEELTELLETLAAESLEKALAICARTTAKLLKRRGVGDSPDSPSKKLPARVAGPASSRGFNESA